MLSYNRSSSCALFSCALISISLRSSLSVVHIQNHVIISTNAHVNNTLFFKPSPHELDMYPDVLYIGDFAEKR